MAKGKKNSTGGVRISNRKAWHNFQILEVVECGIELLGTEVKSIRAGQASIGESYARIKAGQLFLVGAEIAQYPNAKGSLQHEVNRDRRLLIHRRQLDQLEAHVRQKGKTLVPLAMYFKRGWAKCEVGIAVGKRQYDKRRALKDRQQKRDVAREMNRRR